MTDTQTDRRVLLLGIASAMGASCFFSINDSAIKFLSGGYALHQIVLIRSLIGMMVMFAIIAHAGTGLAAFRTRRLGLHLVRGGFVVTSNFCFFLGLAAMPIADAVALFFIAPLLITALSVPMLGEKVGPRRWAAVGVGLLGVVVMLRPGAGLFHPAMLLPLIAALCYAMLHMLTRRMGGTESAVTLTLYVQMTFTAVCILSGLVLGHGAFAGQSDPSLIFLTRAWEWPAAADWPILALVGLASAMGALLITHAYRSCEAALVAPFEYISMPLAIIFGLVIFDEWPDPLAWVGIALICGAGLYTVWRETRANPTAPPLASVPGNLRSSAVGGTEVADDNG
ncbi:DMT family transporter [Pseudorhodobacter ferrugineus]|uniref:DMT family transporter n=1 Tax=Pseudorhodobacter ferrugineus TaxID=77008 RepID=UPI0003B453B3|nr:DMT family transporter [Pseudorhodobacter ferrugineus]